MSDGSDVDAGIIAASGGRYEKLELLAVGGMGRVVTAWDSKLKRKVAIKSLLTSDDPDAAMRFHREGRALSEVSHPNVLKILDYSGPTATTPYIVMEFIDGADLRAVLDVTLMPEKVALCTMQALCDGVAAVHANNLVHRDIKPDNVLTDITGRIVLGDFGIVRGYDRGEGTFIRGATESVGTPLYASPEHVFAPDAISPASDVFSSGSLFSALLSGVSPYAANETYAVMDRLADGTPTPPPEGTSDFTKQLIARMLAFGVADRPSATEVRDQIRAELARRGVRDPVAELRAFLEGDPDEDNADTVFEAATRIARALPAAPLKTRVATLKVAPKLADATRAVPAQAPPAPRRRATPASSTLPVIMGVVGGLAVTGSVYLWRTRTAPAPVLVATAEPSFQLPTASTVAAPLPEPAPAPSAPAAPSLAVIPPAAPKDEPPTVRESPALVRLITKPWAKVTIDGEASGTTPVLKVAELKPGKHVLLFDNPNFKPKVVQIEVKANERRDLRVELEKP